MLTFIGLFQEKKTWEVRTSHYILSVGNRGKENTFCHKWKLKIVVDWVLTPAPLQTHTFFPGIDLNNDRVVKWFVCLCAISHWLNVYHNKINKSSGCLYLYWFFSLGLFQEKKNMIGHHNHYILSMGNRDKEIHSVTNINKNYGWWGI